MDTCANTFCSKPNRRVRWLVLLLFFAGPVPGRAQPTEAVYTPEDRLNFDRLIQGVRPGEADGFGSLLTSTGRQMLGTPYEAGTLEGQGPEALVVNLRGLDCTTFVENTLVIGGMVQSGQGDWDTYLEDLEQLRYRDGVREGYPSRLHYFTDWIRNNEQKGLVRDITRQLGGVTVRKEINFMGTHPELYPALSSEEDLERVRRIENGLSGEQYYVLPREAIPAAESQIRSGDIIALATSVEGLDVTHTGFALRRPDGALHLLHASTSGAVEVSSAPLAEYLRGIRGNTGIIVVRPLPPKE
jgi:hypothetical protein